MLKDFYAKMKPLGFMRKRNRKGKVSQTLGWLEFWVELDQSGAGVSPRFGINVNDLYEEGCRGHSFVMMQNAAYMGDIYFDCFGRESDSWSESDWEGISRVLDQFFVPWFLEYSDLRSLAQYYEDRIARKINRVGHWQDEEAMKRLGEAGKELLGFAISDTDTSKPEMAPRLNEYLIAIYRSLEDRESERKAALEYAAHLSFKYDFDNKHHEYAKKKFDYISDKYRP